MPVNVYIQPDPALMRSLHHIERLLGRISQQLGAIDENTEDMMADLTSLQQQVNANGDAVQSAITLINGLAEQIRAAADDPAEIQAIADQLRANTESLAAAVVANTSAAPGDGTVETPVESEEGG